MSTTILSSQKQSGPKTPETNSPAGERRFLTLAEAAWEISCTRRFLENRISDNELSTFKPSKRLVRISRAEFDRWIETFTSKRNIL
ncbi:MAG: hypothetical protein EXS41_00340 [Opitutaceae bacterium]|nr:hypothetical protein [Opitutaceae bacterium]